MKLTNYTLLLILLSTSSLSAQNNELAETLEEIKPMVGTVQVRKDMVEQELTYDADQPYRIEITINEEGDDDVMVYTCNLALLDKQLVKFETSKSGPTIELSSGRQDMIKVSENGIPKGYTDELTLYATDIEQAKKLKELFQNAVAIATPYWESTISLPEDYNDLVNWVSEKVVSQDVDEQQILQSWKIDKEIPTRFLLEQDEEGENTSFSWDMADIQAEKIDVDIKKDAVILTMRTATNEPYIQLTDKDGEQEYEKELSLYMGDIDDAIVLQKGLKKLVTLAGEKRKELKPVLESTQAAFELLNANVQSIQIGNVNFQQKVKGACMLTMEVIDMDKAESLVYELDAADLSGKSIDIDIKKDIPVVSVTTKTKRKLIQLSENGTHEDYESELSVMAPGIPTARNIALAMDYLSENCRSDSTIYDWNSLKTAVTMSNSEYEQTLSFEEGDACKWILETNDIGSKKMKQERYIFALSDMDDRKLDFDVKGNEIFVQLEAMRGQEVIQLYTDGEELTYEDELRILAKDIPTAKIMVRSIKDMVTSCRKK